MQISHMINHRSILSYLISMESRLIVLLLCNYQEFTQDLDSQGVWGDVSALFDFLLSWPCKRPCDLGLWRSDNPGLKHIGSVTPGYAPCYLTVDEQKCMEMTHRGVCHSQRCMFVSAMIAGSPATLKLALKL